MQLNLQGASVFPNLPVFSRFQNSHPALPRTSFQSCPFRLCSFLLICALVYSASSRLLNSVFKSVLPNLLSSLTLISKYVMENWINHAEVFSSFPSSYLLSFHPSLFCSLIPSLPKKKKRREEAQSNWIPPNSEGNVDST